MTVKKYNKTQALLRLLQDGHFHSGQSLGETLGITRSAIWKAIQNLQKQGVEVQSVNGKGYRIPFGLSLLDPVLINDALKPEAAPLLNKLVCLENVDSTNDYLLKAVDHNNPKTIACFAEQQTAGKGRLGREWLSPYGNNIYHSLLWYFDKDPSELMGLSLAIAVATARALQTLGIRDHLELKWPNDLLWRSQKFGGVLVEMLAEPQHHCAVVIGIGINTRLTLQQSLDRPITSTESILGKPTNRNVLAAELLNQLLPALNDFNKNGLKNFINDWESLDSFRGRMVRLNSTQKEIIGLMRGITLNGELLLEDTQGRVSTHLSGEMSLRKLKE